ncbi:helix-turn-helix domain-containing protein [Fredinandcohnia humi]
MFGQRLRELRVEHGYTMEEVGKKIGVKKSSYASYETKYRQPPLEKLKSFSRLYGVSVDYILGLTDEKNNEESFNIRLKEELRKRGIHWDGLSIPEEVLLLLEKTLEDAIKKQSEHSKEG